jgi:phosphoribosylanthranilate isomerase
MESKVKIKICGMRDVKNIRDVGALHPDYMGFIFYPSSPRYVGEDFSIPEDLPHAIKRVGVFVNDSHHTIRHQVRKHDLSIVQLHGDEPESLCAEVQAEGVEVIKVFSIGEEFDFSVLKKYKPYVNYFLFDTKGKFYGGNSKTFNWKVLEKYDQDIPFFLSGGLTLDNIQNVFGLNHMNLHALDINSGVEDLPGVKSVKKIEEVMNIVNRTNSSKRL